jgi:hypothetical protein
MNLKNTFLSSLMIGFVIFVLCLAVSAINVYIIGNCDSKLGCSRAVTFVGFLGGVTGFVSAMAYAVVSVLRNRESASITTAIFSGVVLTPAVFTIMDWNTGEIGMLFGWFALSVFVIYICMRIFGKKHEIT